MASYTTNLNLKKPAGSENVAIGDINNNMDAIDNAYGTLTTPTSTTVTSLDNGTGKVYFDKMPFGVHVLIDVKDISNNKKICNIPSGYGTYTGRAFNAAYQNSGEAVKSAIIYVSGGTLTYYGDTISSSVSFSCVGDFWLI